MIFGMNVPRRLGLFVVGAASGQVAARYEPASRKVSGPPAGMFSRKSFQPVLCHEAPLCISAGSSACIVPPSENKSYHEVLLSASSEIFMQNSIILIPNLISTVECKQLMEAAECRVKAGPDGRVYHGQDVLQSFWGAGLRLLGIAKADQDNLQVDPLERLPVKYLGAEAERLSKAILEERVLAFFEKELPEVAEQLFGRSSGLAELQPSFSNNEPAVNRYVAGGEFPAHKDGYAISILILLSETGAFAGGGTSFWQQSRFSSLQRLDRHLGEEFVLHPHRGMGVLFNGKLSHAGRRTESGLRHVFVASFSLSPPPKI